MEGCGCGCFTLIIVIIIAIVLIVSIIAGFGIYVLDWLRDLDCITGIAQSLL